ncbi:MAG: hypothetical protein JWL86_193 [Rhizobium sp.]|nr:hypothetical protein [Rhizobium sp.]
MQVGGLQRTHRCSMILRERSPVGRRVAGSAQLRIDWPVSPWRWPALVGDSLPEQPARALGSAVSPRNYPWRDRFLSIEMERL